LPQAATMMVLAPMSSGFVAKVGNKIVVATGLLLVTVSLALFATFDVHVSALHVILVTALMGAGMANVMAPCTDSIMGSLPRNKAGVGSAVNDTTRQMGGAIGVAVFGSLMASHFTSSVASSLHGTVPAGVLTSVGDNIGQAVGAAHESAAAQPFAAQIISASNNAFVGGLHTVGFVAAGVTFVAAIAVAVFLPARAQAVAPIETGFVHELEGQLA
jgi:Na+/melibiose symporter-like transporter